MRSKKTKYHTIDKGKNFNNDKYKCTEHMTRVRNDGRSSFTMDAWPSCDGVVSQPCRGAAIYDPDPERTTTPWARRRRPTMTATATTETVATPQRLSVRRRGPWTRHVGQRGIEVRRGGLRLRISERGRKQDAPKTICPSRRVFQMATTSHAPNVYQKPRAGTRSTRHCGETEDRGRPVLHLLVHADRHTPGAPV
ncbi:unnamed protein product [Trichogramma brassicae]|uniref:Uncharacterized protein n=1 Tax=Trichogramma brassicae TaxID=86971 RepID=A0A6H5HTV1_9HYME|nr:unnamed protein product [Trichogramma brassicae]